MIKRWLLLGLLGVVLTGPAAAASPAFDIYVDPRFELLGVLHHLAGRRRADPATDRYRERVERRFGSFRGHPVLDALKKVTGRGSDEALGTVLIYYSAPPKLARLDKKAYFHYMRDTRQLKEMDLFLKELRAFARASDFMGFFRENRAFYQEMEASTRRAFADIDPVASLESFVGMPLGSKVHYILPLLWDPGHNFIVPYPNQMVTSGAKAFDVYTMSTNYSLQGYGFWNELIYVFIDPSFHYFDKLNVPVPAAFYGPEIARCRELTPDCAKHYVSDAIIHHLVKKHRPSAYRDYDLNGPYVKALTERLDEYERHREKYPTLWDFYPRLLGVFHEKAFPGARLTLAVPRLPAIRKAVDFFDPALSPPPDTLKRR